jgi:hypothetical protein
MICWKVNFLDKIIISVHHEKRQSYGIILKSVMFFFILYIPVVYVHEIGHTLVCFYEGDQVVTFTVSWITGVGHSSCSPEPNNQFLYHIAGGAFASVVSATFLILWRTIPNYVKIVSITFAITQGINAIIESFAYDSYIKYFPIWYIVLMVITFALFTGLMALYIRQPSTQSSSGFRNNIETRIQESCSKCGNNNPKESSFCNKCGFTLK